MTAKVGEGHTEHGMSVWGLIWRLLCYKPWLYALDAFLLIVNQLTPLLPGLIARQFFNVLMDSQPANLGIPSIIALFVGVTLARVGVIFAAVSADILEAFYVLSLLRRNMLGRLLELPGARALRESFGETMSRFRDDPEQVWGAVTLLPDTIGALISMGSTFVILYGIDHRMTLYVFLPMVIVFFIAKSVSGHLERLRRQTREASAQLTGAIGEAFGAVQAIQVAAAEVPVTDHIDRLGQECRRTQAKEELLSAILTAVERGTGTLGLGFILLFAASSMRSGTFTVGDFSLFASYLAIIADYSSFAGYYVALYKQTKVSFERMLAVISGAPQWRLVKSSPLYFNGKPGSEEVVSRTDAAVTPVPLAGKGLFPARTDKDSLARPLERLSVRGLSCLHPGTDKGVAGVDLDVDSGTVTVVTGKVGSGKTTLLRAILGLLPPDSGQVLWNGEAIADPSRFLVPPRCAYTGQVPVLFSDTVKENILFGMDEESVDVGAAVRSAAFEQDLAEMEKGLETMIGPRGMRLSGGQIQRVAAARMFGRNAELLVFDDLSSALDVETEKTLWERLFRGRLQTCLVVSTRPIVLLKADRIVVLSEGRVADQGTLDELLGRCAEMREIWEAGGGSTVDRSSVSANSRRWSESLKVWLN